MAIADDRQLDSGSPKMSSERHVTLRHPLAPFSIFPLVLLISGCVTREMTASNQMPEIAAIPAAPPETPMSLPLEQTIEVPPPEPAPPVKTEPRPQRPGPTQRPRARASQEAGTRPDPKPMPIAPNELVGFDFASVLRILRRPDAVENNTLSIVWTYSESACVLQLFFYPDIETAKYHLLKFDLKDGKGERLANSNLCMQRIAIMRNDE